MSPRKMHPGARDWQKLLYSTLFESGTHRGKLCDVILLLLITLSTTGVMLESVEFIGIPHKRLFLALEWTVTFVFAVEYVLRILSLRNARVFVTSFFGVVDLLAFLPTLLTVFFAGRAYFVVIRVFRLLRVFRIFKLGRSLREGHVIIKALMAGRQKILVFLFGVGTLVIVIGTMMYLVEGAEHGYTSIPRSIYWAIVTLTTVGYGDIAPQTVLGQALSSVVMILGYSIIAVPTGIITVEISRAASPPASARTGCPSCSLTGHDRDARFCKRCGSRVQDN